MLFKKINYFVSKIVAILSQPPCDDWTSLHHALVIWSEMARGRLQGMDM